GKWHPHDRLAFVGGNDLQTDHGGKRRPLERRHRSFGLRVHREAFAVANLIANSTASVGAVARASPSISGHDLSATMGRPNFFAKPISASVPPSPGKATTASQLAMMTALRASPIPVAITNSLNSLALARS